ncbi:unnamed protein product [Ambrosiozyma monospora]|uniref:Unnamed protein product n=1 Tax=Ambrosiozyma monospora TaxID=43982 RepID=A0ACB5SWY8_AMBMO|nr:unnamed protein product [Ambrosiozyma monospora]
MVQQSTHRIIFVGGTAGCGKSTIGELLTETLNSQASSISGDDNKDKAGKSTDSTKTSVFIEGDKYHPQANIEKMAHGIPLHDDDRWGWLENLGNLARQESTKYQNVIVSCSMLKLAYRDLLRKTIHGGSEDDGVEVFMFLLYNDYQVIYDRMTKREGHFMKAEMLKSQFTDLELPDVTKEHNCFKVDCNEDSPDVITSKVLKIMESSTY